MRKKCALLFALGLILGWTSVASKASAHYIVEKKEEKERTRTYVRLLSEDERIYEVARLMSGEDVTKAALETAKTLMN